MGTIETIARQVVSVDPALQGTALLCRLPDAKVKVLKAGLVITVRVKDPDPTVTPDLMFEFDKASRLTSVSWRHMLNDMNSASDVFDVLDRLICRRMLVKPTEFGVYGTAKNRSSQSLSWHLSKHQRLSLEVFQPAPRTMGREVILRHGLRQPHAMVAAAPALWSMMDA